MPRLVYHRATDPVKIDPKTLDPEKLLSICACGISQKFPFCDGSHKKCRANEQPGILYVYDRDNREVVEERPDVPPAPPPVPPASDSPPPTTAPSA